MTTRIVRCIAIAILIPAAALAQSGPRKSVGTAAPVHLTLAPTGNEARFIVRETLAGASFPNDAIGVTKSITGDIVLGADGKLDTTASRITVQMTTLVSDQARRDNWIRHNTLKTDSFPTTVIVIKELRGFPAALPTTGSYTFELIGSLTIHGVTKPWTWEATVTAAAGEFTGKASTHLKFADFGMEQPRVMMVLSVVDDIKLEYDFHFVKAIGN